MSVLVEELIDWLQKLDPSTGVGVDYGAFALVVENSGAYYEIGGVDEEDGEEDE